jgi:hypothetical protein
MKSKNPVNHQSSGCRYAVAGKNNKINDINQENGSECIKK